MVVKSFYRKELIWALVLAKLVEVVWLYSARRESEKGIQWKDKCKSKQRRKKKQNKNLCST